MFISSILSTNGSGMAGPRSCAMYVRFIITKKNNKMLNMAKKANVFIRVSGIYSVCLFVPKNIYKLHKATHVFLCRQDTINQCKNE